MTNALPGLVLTRWTDAPAKTLDVLIDAAVAADPVRQAAVEHHAQALMALARYGAFPAGRLVPGIAPLTLVERAPEMGVVASLRVERVDYRVWQLLRELLVRDETTGPFVRHIEVRERNDDGGLTWRLRGVDEAVDALGYPPRVPALEFSLIDEDAADMVKNRRCVVTLAPAYTDEVLAELLHRMTQWVELLEQGAYAPTMALEGHAVVERGSLHAYDVDSLELVLSLYEASEAGWSSLLNLLHHFSVTVARIADVSIE
jgi:hypothetical protein